MTAPHDARRSPGVTGYWILGFRDDEDHVRLPMTEPIEGADKTLLAAARLLNDETELVSVVAIVADVEDPPPSLWIRRHHDGFAIRTSDDDAEMRRAVTQMDAEITTRPNGH